MDGMSTVITDWPNVGNIVNYVTADGRASNGVIREVIKRGDYPIVRIGLFEHGQPVQAWVKSKFDPDADRPGSWHYPIRES